MRTIPTIAILAVLAVSGVARAQLTPAERASVVQTLSKALVDRYVVKQKAEEVAKLLDKRLKEGGYDSLVEGKSFADALTTEINAVCRDAHLRVRYSPEKLPIRKDAGTPSKVEIEENRKMTRLSNAGFDEVRRLRGNIGYVKFNQFVEPSMAERPVRAVMEFVKDTDALIFDIRDNGGGYPETVQLICSYLFDKPTHINSLIMRDGDKLQTKEFRTHRVKGPKYLDKPMYVLVSKRTGSGAEEFAYNLQTQKRATILGVNTWGGANPGDVFRIDDHFMAFIPNGMARNPITGKNWEGTGVTPDVKVEPQEALSKAQEMALKLLIANATGADKERLESVLKDLLRGA